LKGRTIAFLESRLADQVGELIVRRGGIPLSAPALKEEPIVDPAAIARLVGDWTQREAKLAIFQTGVGTRALFSATDALQLTSTLSTLLANTLVVARGPKPTGVLRQRGIRIDFSAADPFTTAEVLDAINRVALSGEVVVVQRYGDANAQLNDALIARGASVVEVPTYRWALPDDVRPLVELMNRLDQADVDAVVFTSASQVNNLMAVAEAKHRATSLRAALNATRVASIGPVCSAALAAAGITVKLEANPPKLGPMMEALDAAFENA
jgi:uroporphyrinogen-III synthase